MHKERVALLRSWRWRALFALLFIAAGVCSFTILSQPHKALAAGDLSSSYNWKPVKIGGGGFVTGLVIHPTTPNIMYARTDVGGAYRWDASSQSWSQMLLATNVANPIRDGALGRTDYMVESIALSKTNDQLVYMAVGGTWDITNATDTGRIIKSTDRGQTWTDPSGHTWAMCGNCAYRQGGERLAVDPANENIVYFGSRKGGLWVSTDGAATWSQVSTSQIPPGSNSGDPVGVKFIIFDPSGGTSNGKTNRIYAGVAGQGIYRSDDAGGSWSKVLTNNSSQFPYDVGVDTDGNLLTSIDNTSGNGSVYRYTSSSNSWQDITPGTDNDYTVAIDPFNTQRFFVSASGLRNQHFWRSTDRGDNWTALDITIASADIKWILNTDESNWMTAARLVFDPYVQGKLWFAQGTGVWTSTNLDGSPVTWNMTSNGIEETVATDMAAPPGGKPVFLIEDRNGFYGSNLDAYPNSPILTNKFSAGTSVEYSAGNPQFVTVVSSDTRSINPDQSGYSTDGGATWTQFSGSRNYSDLYGGNIAVSATDTNNLVWLPTNNKPPYVSTDKGATWTKIPAFSSLSSGLNTMIWWHGKKALDSDKVNGGTFYLYVTNNGGEFYRSTDGGQTWQKTSSAPSSLNNDSNVSGQVRAVPGKAGHVWMSNAAGGLSYSTDGGDNWTKVSAFQDARAFNFGKAINGASYPAIYVYGEINNVFGVYRSADQGTNWDLVAQYPMNLYGNNDVVSGDMNIEGRVYVGFSGNGYVYGDISSGNNGGTPTPGVTPTPTPGGGNQVTVTLNPIADRDNYASNTGTESTINASIYQIMYFKFDLSTVSSHVTNATFRVYRPYNDTGTVTFTAYQVNSDSWSETDNSSLPAIGSLITTATTGNSGYVEFDVSNFVNAEKNGDGIVTIAVKASSTNWTTCNSRESANNKPQLVVTSN